MPGPLDPNSADFNSAAPEFSALGFSAQAKLIDANKKFKATNPAARAKKAARLQERQANIARANRSLNVGSAGTAAVSTTPIAAKKTVAQRRAATTAAAGVETNNPTSTGGIAKSTNSALGALLKRRR